MQENINSPRGVLFDLDGTLADTAPDLAHAVNLQRLARGMEALALEQLSPFVSQGARGLLGKAFGITPEHSDYELLRTEFLRNYEDALCVESQLFSGVRALLAELDAQGYLWGVVTNKVERYALPLLKQLQLDPMVVVGGDTTAHSKPHPLPLIYAAQRMQLSCAQCIYVGDDLRDIQAGHAAGMRTVIAAYGYGEDAITAQDWGADFLITEPLALLPVLASCVDYLPVISAGFDNTHHN